MAQDRTVEAYPLLGIGPEVASPLGLPVRDGYRGAAISPLRDRGPLAIGMLPDDAHYFDVHHTKADTVDESDPDALREGTAAIAALAWVFGERVSGPA